MGNKVEVQEKFERFIHEIVAGVLNHPQAEEIPLQLLVDIAYEKYKLYFIKGAGELVDIEAQPFFYALSNVPFVEGDLYELAKKYAEKANEYYEVLEYLHAEGVHKKIIGC